MGAFLKAMGLEVWRSAIPKAAVLRRFGNRLCCSLTLLLSLTLLPPAQALTDPELRAIAFDQHPGAQLSLNLPFTTAAGTPVRLGDYFHGKPVILVPGYFRCRMLCGGVSDGLLRALQGTKKTAGPDFRVVYISIDPAEKLSEAQARKRIWLQRYGRLGTQNGCEFLSGTPEAIAEISKEIGFHYRYDPASGEFAHPAGFVVLQPGGTISRYFFGVSFSAGELDKALDGAAARKPPSMVQELLLLCFHYNPLQSRYGMAVMVAVRLMALGTIAGVAFIVIGFKRKADEPSTPNPP